MDQIRRPKTACWMKLWSVSPPGRSTDLAHGPHYLILDTWHLITGCLGRFQEFQPVVPSYKYKERGVQMKTSLTSKCRASLVCV